MNCMKQITLIILCLLSIHTKAHEYSKSWKDVNYAGDSNAFHNLDIYLQDVEKRSAIRSMQLSTGLALPIF